jgi:hypothetical protein
MANIRAAGRDGFGVIDTNVAAHARRVLDLAF